MEKISEFMDMEIYMHFNRYMPPFVILHYGTMRTLITIENIEAVSGNVPNKQNKNSDGVGSVAPEELLELWERMLAGLKLSIIEPLKG